MTQSTNKAAHSFYVRVRSEALLCASRMTSTPEQAMRAAALFEYWILTGNPPHDPEQRVAKDRT